MRIIAFDFDGTLSDSEMTVLLGKQNGTADEMADITERAMNDEISYAESLRSRARLLDGLEEELAEEAYGQVELRPGAAELIQRLRDYGHHVAIFTGGFRRGVERALEKEGVEVDDIVSNSLPVKGGRLTGDVEGSLIEGTKDTALENYAAEHDVPMDRTVAVGDGANDLPMLEVAGLSVGFVPKDAVRPACDVVVSSMNRLGKVFEGHNILDADEE
ncbi:phosphoserine phosphatase SerB [Haloferax mediterranei ATCC 33500]|uniref:phosphoserine phosphatase n=1 Tax=Haloferax mediterranei (strain ATCC 33500 / DSM 1411 / JCM 8866 / NBRC 14739 / NCIMB 2177 / R-4) TaxID=523841 RepID=I3R8R1_HALMT|nr:phosphoserine phosphatase SerB [Haloferax mediterranei]AFK20621.1 phosphoserine phosphatase [Haloferax mediterranei ATCC 33500]AHZ22895.1 phosphoserine phosphatase [Haloferax mediterranei ATCC 33500]EMA03060.1 phosphoserine phosphatase [Haloferax mediterranei ATCC 33500]MDX5987759.1 phosphoserine phosphatase SerB [Haloferax mediterranei ATCC 33500]QCQ74238.1 phosphoserine phosphatase SerB [Haloferax mediterranei ATCC 33500]